MRGVAHIPSGSQGHCAWSDTEQVPSTVFKGTPGEVSENWGAGPHHWERRQQTWGGTREGPAENPQTREPEQAAGAGWEGEGGQGRVAIAGGLPCLPFR